MIQILVVPAPNYQYRAVVLAGREVLFDTTRWSYEGARRAAERFLNNKVIGGQS